MLTLARHLARSREGRDKKALLFTDSLVCLGMYGEAPVLDSSPASSGEKMKGLAFLLRRPDHSATCGNSEKHGGRPNERTANWEASYLRSAPTFVGTLL